MPARRAMVPWLLALAAAPGETARALGNLAMRRRVRGWNALHRAASRHPGYYGAWIDHAEPAHVERFCASRRAAQSDLPHPACPPIAVVLTGGLADGAARRSAREGLGEAAVMLDGAGEAPGAVLARARAAGCRWVLPLGAGDRLAPALGAVLGAALGAEGAPADDASVVYWDEDRLRDDRRAEPFLKPDWDPLLHAGHDLLTGAALLGIEAALAAADGPAHGADGWAGLLHRAALAGRVPRHIPLVLTHRAGSEAPAPKPAPKAAPVPAPILPAIADWPGVSIIIPTRDRMDLLDVCLRGLAMLDYPGPTEILIVDNGSVEPASHAYLAALASDGRARILPHPGAFNFAAMINHAAREAGQPYLCLLNNDIEPLDGAWLGRMMAHAIEPRCGAVGARLLYPDRTIQHAGIAIGIGGAAGHVAKGFAPDAPAHHTWHAASRRVSAVTAACLVVDGARFAAVGGMDEENFSIDFNDVDLCLKLDRAGFENRVIASATLLHYESKSRGPRRLGADAVRFARELANLRALWGTAGHADPWFHPLFRTESEECLLKF